MLGGVMPVLGTPFHDDESVDTEGFERTVRAVAAAGARSAMFPGFASEYHKLDDGERTELIDVLLRTTTELGGFSAVVSVPDHATHVAVRRTRQAVDGGAAAVNLLPPHFLGPSRPAVLAHIEAVLRAAGTTPVILQYAPAQTGTSLDAPTIAALARRHGNLAFVKVESTPPGALVQALAESDPPVASLVGYAGVQLPDALRRGVQGVQPGCSFVELYMRIWQLWHGGEEQAAERLHSRLLPYISYWMLNVELVVAAEKEISKRRGWFGSARCRAPSWQLDQQEMARIDAFLEEFDDMLRGDQ